MSAVTHSPISEARSARVGARHIHFCEFGTGEAVLMLHGGGPGASGLSNYGRNVDALSRHFRVLVVDMPGYGASTKGLDRSDPFGDLARTMLGFLDAIGVERAHVIGNSLGGACALRMALERPNKVSSLVLMGPGGVNTTRSIPTKGLTLLLDYYRGTGPSRAKLTRFIRDYLVFDGSQVPDSVIEERFLASVDPEVVAAPPLRRPTSIAGALRMDFTRDRRLAECRVPTLVLWGDADKVNRPSGASSLQRTMPNCDAYVFSRTGHWVQWERADEFNAAAIAFMSRHASR